MHVKLLHHPDRQNSQITGKMKNNLDELMRRDVALDDLEETAGGLAEGAKHFHQTSKKVSYLPSATDRFLWTQWNVAWNLWIS